jgi:cold shock CspA family protein
MQGTIKLFEDAARTGTVVTDDRTEVAIEAGSFDDDALLTLRIGQRVIFEIEVRDGQPTARHLRLVTFADR